MFTVIFQILFTLATLIVVVVAIGTWAQDRREARDGYNAALIATVTYMQAQARVGNYDNMTAEYVLTREFDAVFNDFYNVVPV